LYGARETSKCVDLASEIKCLHSAVGLLPKKLPIQIVRWRGIAWHLLGSLEPASAWTDIH